MSPDLFDIFSTCLMTLFFLFAIVCIVAIYGRFFQRYRANQDIAEEEINNLEAMTHLESKGPVK